MDPTVYRFVYNNVERTNQDPKPNTPPLPNGSNPKAHKAFAQLDAKELAQMDA